MGHAEIIRTFGKAAKYGGLVAFSTIVLAGCDETSPSMDANTSSAQHAGKTVERDVEAPQVFSASEAGLWDGRPSLGGVWVAHPDVKDPERVIIRNTSNGKFVVGALFRRARDMSGPLLQISSDAAEALGMLAGAPAPLNVTALRKEETPIEEPAKASQTLKGTEEGVIVIEPTPVPEPTLPPVSSLEKPFIQLGIFSVQGNANRAADRMRTVGLIPSIKRGERDGKAFWRVLVGPASNASERASVLTKIKGAGFSDAYAVTH